MLPWIYGCLTQQRGEYRTKLPCHSTELQPRYQLVNCERKQKQYKAGIMRSHEILHIVWVQVVQYFTPQSYSGFSAKCCIFMSWWLSSDSQWERQRDPLPASVLSAIRFSPILLESEWAAHKQMQHIQGVSVKVRKREVQHLLSLYIL